MAALSPLSYFLAPLPVFPLNTFIWIHVWCVCVGGSFLRESKLRQSHQSWKSPFKMNRIFIYLFIYLDFIYLFMRDTHRGTDTGRGRSRLHAGNPTRDLIPGLQDHALAQGSAKLLSHPGCPWIELLISFVVPHSKYKQSRITRNWRKNPILKYRDQTKQKIK